MRLAVHFLEVLDRHLRIDLRHLQAGVPQHLLDCADVGTPFEHQRRHRLPEEMTRSLLPDLRRFDLARDATAETIFGERLPERGHVERLLLGIEDERRTTSLR